MQEPTCFGMAVRTTFDAKKIFEAVNQNFLPIMSRRLDTRERQFITSGQVFVWEERISQGSRLGHNASGSLGIERWTDSITWGPSRVKEEFLYYREKRRPDAPINIGSSNSKPLFRVSSSSATRNLVKQTYSVFVKVPQGCKKWHLTAYFVEDAVHSLHTVDNHPAYPFLRTITFPENRYTSARGPRQRDSIILSPPATLVDILNIHRPMVGQPHHIFRAPLGLLSSSPVPNSLAPLEYLERASPQTRQRHPVDEKAIMSFPIYDCFVGQ